MDDQEMTFVNPQKVYSLFIIWWYSPLHKRFESPQKRDEQLALENEILREAWESPDAGMRMRTRGSTNQGINDTTSKREGSHLRRKQKRHSDWSSSPDGRSPNKPEEFKTPEPFSLGFAGY
jgi:hypothetical protein